MKHNHIKLFLNLSFSFITGLLLVGCGAGEDKPTVELIQDMMDQVSLKSQDYDQKRNTPSLMTAPANTVARGKSPYPYSGDPLAANDKLKNPYSNDKSEAFLARGKDRYTIYCSVCHGAQGKGDGPVSGYMIPKPRSLLTENARSYKDGRLFHVITEGQGVMGGYATQITDSDDRWAIVSYVRMLQTENPVE